jgi:lactate permease
MIAGHQRPTLKGASMSFGMVLLAVSPILVIFLALVVFRRPADVTGLIGWAFTVILAALVFRTGWVVLLRASLSGLVASLPVALIVVASILQMTLMQQTGALGRIVVALKTVSRSSQVVQVLIINVGIGTLLTALGAVPVSVLPPIMIALGYSATAAITLPAIGFDSLCTYALLGTPVVIFAQFTGQTPEAVGSYFARFMPVITSLIALAMLLLVGRWRMVARGLVPALLTGLVAGFIAIGMNRVGLVTVTGVASGAGVVVAMGLYLKLLSRQVFDRSALTEADRQVEQRMSLLRALSPWLILIALSLVTNEPWFGIKRLLFDRIAMPWQLIPGQPERLRIFWQAYWWIIVSTLISLPLLRTTGAQWRQSLALLWKRAPRPTVAAAVFFAIAYIINHSGKPGLIGADGRWLLPDPGLNMVAVVATASAQLFGKCYALVAPYLGLLAGFVSGTESSAIAMLTRLHLSTAERIGSSGMVIAAASAIGGGLASVISPSKLQNAAAAIDRIGMETEVIRTTVVVAIVIVLAVSGLAFIWA